ncbi:MAG: UDP-N-acetylmuramate dehydrogenase [Pseudomonadota bacterium]
MVDCAGEFAGKWRQNFVLAKSNWFNIGGPAQYLYKPQSTFELSRLVKHYGQHIKITPLGVGSNLLVRDGGINGVVVKFGHEYNYINFNNGLFEVGVSVLMRDLAKTAAAKNCSGFEFLIGIPGTLGGALAMNAGAYGSDISKIVKTVEVIMPNGDIKRISAKDVGYNYRQHGLPQDVIFTRAWLEPQATVDQSQIEQLMTAIMAERQATQPVTEKTSGSTFKNPDNDSAWRLIAAAGCRGLSIGGAMVSTKHCNFFINQNNATAYDMESLIKLVQTKVKNKFDIDLECEIKIVGNKA